MLPIFNDEDIVEEVIENLLSQEIELVVLDNGSTDKTFQICEKFLSKGILKLEKYKSKVFRWNIILKKLYDMAIFESPDWVLRNDSDEFLETGIKNFSLKEAIFQADLDGYNIIQFDRFDFFMTDKDITSAESVKEKFPFYSYHGDFLYRAWKFVPGISPTGMRLGGHCPIFSPGEVYKIYPKKFILRHYNLRSKDQALKKIKEHIKRRVQPSNQPRKMDHIDRTQNYDYSSLIPHTNLSRYNEDNQWNYEKKHAPYIGYQPTKNQLFTNEGLLNSSFALRGEGNWEDIKEQYSTS